MIYKLITIYFDALLWGAACVKAKVLIYKTHLFYAFAV